MLIMTGIYPAAGKGNPHVVESEDSQGAVWAGISTTVMNFPTAWQPDGNGWKPARFEGFL